MTPPGQSNIAEQLRHAANVIEALQAELVERRTREADAFRLTYRRGYFAGHAAGRTGRLRESAPEKHCRKELIP